MAAAQSDTVDDKHLKPRCVSADHCVLATAGARLGAVDCSTLSGAEARGTATEEVKSVARRRVVVGLCAALTFITLSVAIGLGVSLARLSSSTSSNSTHEGIDGATTGTTTAAEFKRGEYSSQVGATVTRQDGSLATGGGSTSGSTHSASIWNRTPSETVLDGQVFRIMRVGAQLETVIEHRLAEGAVDGRGGDAGVTIDSDENTTAAGLFGRDDPPQYPAVGAVLDSGGLLMVAVQGKNGAGLHLQSFQADGLFWHSSGWEAVDIPFKDGPALTTPDGETCFAFLRGVDGNLWFNTMQGSWWGVWNTVEGANVTSAPAAVSHQNNVHVFLRSSAGRLRYGRSSNRGVTWSWSELGGALREHSAPAAAISADGRTINVAIRGRDSAIWHLRLRSSIVDIPWRRVPTLGTVSSSPSLGFLNGDLKIVVRGEDRTTFWEDVLTDEGRSFKGAWRSWNQGFESQPTAVSYSPDPNRLVVLGVNQRGELAVLQRSTELQSSKWATLSPLPAGLDTRNPPRDNEEQPENMGEDEEAGSCFPCQSCDFYDNRCWGRCNFQCSSTASCAIDEAYIQGTAARHACTYVWGACGSGGGLGRMNLRSAPLVAPSLPVQLRDSDEAACRLKAKDFCEDSIWRVDLYEVTSTVQSGGSCGDIVFNGNRDCSSAYAYSLFRALVPESCSVATEKMFQGPSAGAPKDEIPMEEEMRGIPWQRPS